MLKRKKGAKWYWKGDAKIAKRVNRRMYVRDGKRWKEMMLCVIP